MTAQTTDLRCPVTPRRLFGKLRTAEATIVEGNLVEFACDDCRKTLRRLGEPVGLVLHRFDMLGQCIETEKIHSA